MTAVHSTIKTAYEENGMTPEQIAEDQELDIIVVKGALAAYSSKYRKDVGLGVKGTDFTDEDLSEMNEIIIDVARNASLGDGAIDYRTRLAAATYVRDDKKGRKETMKALQGIGTMNILQFNQHIAEVRSKVESIKKAIPA